MKKQILLTGGNGFIGKNIRESFLAQKYDIFAPRSYELDLTDTAAVDTFFATRRFDAVIHAAAKPGHRNAKDTNRLFYTNMRMFENLARHTECFGRLINLGSGAVYDAAADNRMVCEEEIGRRMGKDDHSFCKYVMHKRIEKTPNMLDLHIFGVFGPYEDWEIRFISNAICKTLFDLPVTLRQNRRFSYLWIRDLMPVLEYFIEHEPTDKSYNVTPDEETELLQAATAVLDAAGGGDIRVATQGYGLNYSGSNARLRAEIPHLRFTPLKEAIQDLYAYYQTNKNMINPDLLLSDK